MKYRLIFVKVLVLIMALFLIKSCYYDSNLPDTVDPGVEISFANDLIPIWDKDCNSSGCHSPGDIPPDLTPANAYDAIISGNYVDLNNPENSELYLWMRGDRNLPMPLTGPNADYNAKVLTWIIQGALNN